MLRQTHTPSLSFLSEGGVPHTQRTETKLHVNKGDVSHTFPLLFTPPQLVSELEVKPK